MNQPIAVTPVDDRDHLYPDQWMLTKTGRRVWPMCLRPYDVCFEDIAHALAGENRYNAHTREPLSVAQHSVFVSQIVERATGNALLALAALLHDGPEAYLKDIPKPIKRALGPVYAEAEARAAIAIGSALEIDPALFEHPAVKRADLIALATEKRDLRDFADPPALVRSEEAVRPDPARIYPMPWTAAKRHFCDRYEQLRAAIGARR